MTDYDWQRLMYRLDNMQMQIDLLLTDVEDSQMKLKDITDEITWLKENIDDYKLTS